MLLYYLAQHVQHLPKAMTQMNVQLHHDISDHVLLAGKSLKRSQMRLSLTSNERFLADFHDQRPGVTSRAFMSLPATKNGEVEPSSYHFLAALVPATTTPWTVLDLACGDGYLLSLIASMRRQPANLVGIDISRGELNAARRQLGSLATLIECRAQEIPLASGTVDLVVCHMALMLMDELDAVIEEVRRLLHCGGVFSFIVGAKPPPSVALNLYLKRLRATKRQLGVTVPALGDRRVGHADKIELLLANRFERVIIEEVNVTRRYLPPELWRWFQDLYDLVGVPEHELARMQEQYLEDLLPQLDADRRIGFTDQLLQVHAIAA